jgi:hypothetical protein
MVTPPGPPTACSDRLAGRGPPDPRLQRREEQGSRSGHVWRFHAFFTTTDPAILDTVAADKTHRGHAVIEQFHSALKNSALAHLPSGVFTANAAWLVLAVIAFNLTRATASLTEPPRPSGARRSRCQHGATSARRITLHLPQAWPWQTAWTALFDRVSDPPPLLAP